jgi:hypothetical protein
MTDKRRTLSDADISSRRSTPRRPRAASIGVSGGDAARSLRRGGAHHDADGAPRPQTKGEAARPGSDRDQAAPQ